MSFFSQHSGWGAKTGIDPIPQLGHANTLPPRIAEGEKSAVLKLKKLEDWAYRLGSMADEAEDERLMALASDILDLRDEVLFELHQHI